MASAGSGSARIDAMPLAKLLRAGELALVWMPDSTHEALHDQTPRKSRYNPKMSRAFASPGHTNSMLRIAQEIARSRHLPQYLLRKITVREENHGGGFANQVGTS
jgi:hypothetical protein